MNHPQPHPERRDFEAYLDGALSEADRAALAAEIAADRELRAEVERQSRIDDSLKRQFQPAAMPAELVEKLRSAATAPLQNERAAPEQATVPLRPRRRLPMFAASMAATIIWAGLGWYFLAPERPWPQDAPPPPLPLAVVYKNAVDSGFKPLWVCKDDQEFASTFKQRHGQGLLLAQMPEGSGMYGLAYSGGITRGATAMLAHAGESPVMVFVDRLDADPGLEQPEPATGLHLFRKEASGLVFYELTPLAEPKVMDYLYPAEVPSR